MMASYCQKELGLYKETGYDLAFAKVETLSSKREEIQKHQEERRKNLTETEEWATHLLSNYSESGGKGHRFAEPLPYTIVFVRDGKFAGNKNGPTIWSSANRALSMKQLFRQVKELVYSTVNQELQSKSKRLERFEVIVVSNVHNAPPRLLLSSAGVASNTTELALGWLAQRNPGYFYQSKFDIFYPFCDSVGCRTNEDKHMFKKWETWFLFEDRNTGDFKNQSCHTAAKEDRENVDDCIERFHHIIKN